jgi:hypothetical protein
MVPPRYPPTAPPPQRSRSNTTSVAPATARRIWRAAPVATCSTPPARLPCTAHARPASRLTYTYARRRPTLPSPRSARPAVRIRIVFLPPITPPADVPQHVVRANTSLLLRVTSSFFELHGDQSRQVSPSYFELLGDKSTSSKLLQVTSSYCELLEDQTR